MLPSGYHTEHPPEKNKCDHFDDKFDPNLPEFDGEILICGHSYHYECFETLERSCIHCRKFYEDGIIYNVTSYLKTLEKGDSNVLKNNDKNCDDNDDDLEAKML